MITLRDGTTLNIVIDTDFDHGDETTRPYSAYMQADETIDGYPKGGALVGKGSTPGEAVDSLIKLSIAKGTLHEYRYPHP